MKDEPQTDQRAHHQQQADRAGLLRSEELGAARLLATIDAEIRFAERSLVSIAAGRLKDRLTALWERVAR